MNEYVFEITQVLRKEIRIKCLDELLADITIRNMFDNGEIKLTQDDCIQSSVRIIKGDDDNQPTLFD